MSERQLARRYYDYTPPPLPTLPKPGQATFVGPNTGASNTARYEFIVPDGIYFVSAVVVSINSATPPNDGTAYFPLARPHSKCRILRGTTELLTSAFPIGTDGVGGGNGGQRGDSAGNYPSYPYNYRSGGGAAGYDGNGGKGGLTSYQNGIHYGSNPGSGGGGSGADGGWHSSSNSGVTGRVGGGVGMQGKGASGAATPGNTNSGANAPGNPGSNLGGPLVGAGGGAESGGGDSGGDLRWKNNIAVTPGEVLIIDLGTDYRNSPWGVGAGARLIYGDSRSFPNNALDVVTASQVLFNKVRTNFVVPSGVTSICVCSQNDPTLSKPKGSFLTTHVGLFRNGTNLASAASGTTYAGGAVAEADSPEVGGGGAATYTGAGGTGGGRSISGDTWTSQSGTVGPGGTKGGDGSSRQVNASGDVVKTPATWGSSIGIKGKMPNGSYSDPVDGDLGGGPPGSAGGELGYTNNIAVTPGETLLVTAETGRLRIIWGTGRSYPNLAYDV